MNLSPAQLTTFSLAFLALGLALAAGLLIAREVRRARSGDAIGRAIRRSTVEPQTSAAGRNSGDDVDFETVAQGRKDDDLPTHWLHTRLGRMLVADEDRRLIDQCGFPSVRAQLVFLVVRVALALLLPLLTWLILKSIGVLSQHRGLTMAFAFVVGFLLPKWVLGYYAAGRRDRVANELPLFVDLLRLLQGVGLSLDQSLQVMATDFGHVLRILAEELQIANRQYSQGRTREHSLQRLAVLYDNENLAGLVALLVQVDRHGGAVQEPLQKYSDRLREHRRMELKERIGKITVKMTGVMVMTLLPALVIVTAGPGFLAIFRSLGAMGK
ncbi:MULTISPECIES: type II secretion system F family protein [unclassified Variovorax]|uniref:type II secretion system F family protein n=1 Tax=unclassified Variovorax TaxID=663243 RepID=UPI00257732FF|nr:MULTISPECIES: type II secretion system F family protein [unclassified Variovorax]MDM0087707.1 type II secretion system F family protein [Variovorax sp. J22G40]MDM0144036.1 type II secretion system F family protein [Variovorax sp. J2P1-31]